MWQSSTIIIYMPSKYYYVYIITNFRKTVLYTGITNNLMRRIYEHKNNLAEGFSKKYFLHDLLYYEIFEDPKSAIEREKKIKSWSRKKKDALIVQFNPKLEDLYKEIL